MAHTSAEEDFEIVRRRLFDTLSRDSHVARDLMRASWRLGRCDRIVRWCKGPRQGRWLAELLVRLGLELPSKPQMVQNVVEKNG